ncbi:uncharacterized protein FFMR_02111 [Fusarium fujikuroi]|nr:uncharacterized protein FFMR_02111 [Fusarium fujikuroi]
MPNKPESNINWDLYIQDVNSVYITQNKTAEETIQFLREKHNLELRLRPVLIRVEPKFGRLGYLSSDRTESERSALHLNPSKSFTVTTFQSFHRSPPAGCRRPLVRDTSADFVPYLSTMHDAIITF